jgi:hypothetical protein
MREEENLRETTLPACFLIPSSSSLKQSIQMQFTEKRQPKEFQRAYLLWHLLKLEQCRCPLFYLAAPVALVLFYQCWSGAVLPMLAAPQCIQPTRLLTSRLGIYSEENKNLRV